MRLSLLVSLVVVPLVGCGISDVACTANYLYGIQITVADSATGSPPAAATLVAASGAFTDSVGPRGPSQLTVNGPPVLVLSTAGERAGIYSVVVRAAGYRDWTRLNVTVTADQCHVRPVKLTARLQSV